MRFVEKREPFQRISGLSDIRIKAQVGIGVSGNGSKPSPADPGEDRTSAARERAA
jgi:hypothetical protein